MSVGEARKVAASGQTEALQVGSLIMPGDRIRTGADAVAILVFSDEGRISLRPDSELWIKQYDVDPSGAKTRIELELVRGTVRQISGNASRAQPDRYRLNTPIAVIGVRGTDFIAKAATDAVEAFVHEGQIVLIPAHVPCASDSTSTCNAVALASSSSGLRYIRMSSTGQVEHREFRPGELEKVFGIETARATKASSPMLASGASDFKLPPGSQFVSDTIFIALGADALRTAAPPGSSDASAPGGTEAVVGTTAASSVTQPVSALPQPNPVAAIQAPIPTQLVWGRFTSASALPVEMTVPYEEARQGRHVTVGELGEYALWRANPPGPLDSSLRGRADFALAGAQAVLVQPSGLSAATVTSASLAVDFDRSTFAAAVSLHHSAIGASELAVEGRVNVEGLFAGSNKTDRVAGALTRDGKEAGYLFSKDVGTGTFRGITLWGRK